MNPADVLQKLLTTNEPIAKLVFAGLGVLAAASIAVTWMGNSSNILYVGLYILGFAFAATMVAYIASNPRTRAVLGWALTVVFCLYLAGLPFSAMGLWGFPTPKCYLEIWVDRNTCEADYPSVKLSMNPPELSLAVFAPATTPARIWLAQVTLPYSGPIYLQFKNTLDRNDIIALAQNLTSQGWPVIGAEQGGEAVASAPDDNEIRFFDLTGRDPAIELANKLNAERPAAPFIVRDFSSSGLITSQGQLEIWLSR